MNPSRIFQILALAHLGLGAVLVLQAIASLVTITYRSVLAGTIDWKQFAVVMMSAILGLIGAVLIQGGTRHRKLPTRQTAIVLATNSSVVAWALTVPLFKSPATTDPNPIGLLVPIAVGLLTYRYLLRPLAERTFPSPETGDVSATPIPHASPDSRFR